MAQWPREGEGTNTNIDNGTTSNTNTALRLAPDGSGGVQWSVGGGGGITSVPQENVCYLTTAGNDSTGVVGDVAKPFLTLTAAMNACSSGDVIVVARGTYAEASPLVHKSGVNVIGLSGGSSCSIDVDEYQLSGNLGNLQNIKIGGQLSWGGIIHIVDNCTIDWTANDESGVVASGTAGVLYLKNSSTIKCDHTGTQGGELVCIELTGTAHIQAENSHFDIDYEGAASGDDVIMIDDQRGATANAVIIDNCSFETECSGSTPAGDVIKIRHNPTTGADHFHSRNNTGEFVVTAGTGDYIDVQELNANCEITNSGESEVTGFANEYVSQNSSVAPIKTDMNCIFDTATDFSDIFDGTMSPTGTIKINGSITPNVIAVAADYGASENWLFDEAVRTAGDFTFPASLSAFPEGAKRTIFNNGTTICQIDPNGNDIDGDSSVRGLYSNGFVTFEKVSGAVKVISSSQYIPYANPADIPGLKIFIDPDNGITTSGNDITEIVSQDGSSFCTFSDPGAGNRPELLLAELNGHNIIEADGTEWMESTDIDPSYCSGGLFAVSIVKRSDLTSDYLLSKYGNTNAKREFYMRTEMCRIYDNTIVYNTSSLNPADNEWVVLSMSFTQSGGLSVYINNNLSARDESPVIAAIQNTTEILRLFRDYSTSNMFNGQMGEMYVYNRPLATSERESVHNHYGAHYNLQDVLGINNKAIGKIYEHSRGNFDYNAGSENTELDASNTIVIGHADLNLWRRASSATNANINVALNLYRDSADTSAYAITTQKLGTFNLVETSATAGSSGTTLTLSSTAGINIDDLIAITDSGGAYVYRRVTAINNSTSLDIDTSYTVASGDQISKVVQINDGDGFDFSNYWSVGLTAPYDIDNIYYHYREAK